VLHRSRDENRVGYDTRERGGRPALRSV